MKKLTQTIFILLLLNISLYANKYNEKQFYGTWKADVSAQLSNNLSLRIIGENTYTKYSESYGNLMFQLYIKNKNEKTLLITAPINEFSLWFINDGFLYEKSLNMDIGELIINNEANADDIYEYLPVMKTFISSLEGEMNRNPESKMKILYLTNNKIKLIEDGIMVELVRK